MQPTQLQVQADAMSVAADLIRRAATAGATIPPHWCFPESSHVDGYLTSTDDTAIRELNYWCHAIGNYSIRSYPRRVTPTGEPRRVWVIEATVEGVSVWLRADVPATVETRPVGAPEQPQLVPVRELVAA